MYAYIPFNICTTVRDEMYCLWIRRLGRRSKFILSLALPHSYSTPTWLVSTCVHSWTVFDAISH